MPVLYNGKQIIPAPFVSISSTSITNDAGKLINNGYSLTLTGKMLPQKGSPNSAGEFWVMPGYPPDEQKQLDEHLESLLRKQEALQKLFSTPGLLLEIQPLNGGMPLTCNPRVSRISFPADNWVTNCEYTVELEADQLYLSGEPIGGEFDAFVSSTANEWSLDITNEDIGIYRLSHTVSAKGRVSYKPDGTSYGEAWENAKTYVHQVLGLGLKIERMQAPDVLDANNLYAYNYLRSVSLSEEAGNYSVTETWTCYDPGDEPPAIDEWTVNTRETLEDGLSQISIEGTVTGLEVRNNTTRELISRKYENANTKFTDYVLPLLVSRVENTSGIEVNPAHLSSAIGRNEISGVISYSYEFNNRPSTTIPGAIRESIRISSNRQADVFASHVIPGRQAGPLKQNINTKTGLAKTIAIDVKLPPRQFNGLELEEPDVTATIMAYKPNPTTPVYIQDDTDDWDPITGNYSRRITFEW